MTALEASLKGQIAAAPSGPRRNCLKVDLAAHLARLGRYDAAKSMVAEVRAEEIWSSPELSSRVLFAEAMIRLEDEFELVAKDRLVRAFAIADAAKLDHVATGAAAWLGHFSFNRNEFAEMRKWFTYCRDRRDRLSPSTVARVCLTLANATRYSGDFDAADRLYSRSRHEAVQIGDGAFLAANMYNRAAIGIARLRLDWARSVADETFVDRSQLEIESARNYSKATANSAAIYLQELWLGRLLQIKGKHANALNMLGDALNELAEAKHAGLKRTILADIAYSNCALGNLSPGRAMIEAFDDADLQSLDPDDCVAFCFQLISIASALALPKVVETLTLRLQAAIANHEMMTKELLAQVQDLGF